MLARALALFYTMGHFAPLSVVCDKSFKNVFLFPINLTLSQTSSQITPENLKLLRLRNVLQF